MGAEYQENRLLTLQAHDPVWGYWVAPRMELGVRSETWDMRTDLGGRRARYEQEAFDYDSFYANVSAGIHTERASWRIEARHAQDTLITGEQVDADTGLPAFERERRTETVAPAWSYSASPTTLLQLSYQTSHVTYGDGAPTSLYDYRQQATQAGVSYDWDARTRLSLNAAGSWFDVPANNFESRTLSMSAAISHRLSQVWKLGLSAGTRETKTGGRVCAETEIVFAEQLRLECRRFDDVAQTDHGLVFGLDVERSFRRSRLSADITREVTPSGSGTEIENDTASMTLDHDLRPSRLWIGLTTAATRRRAVSGDPTAVDRNHYRVEPRFRWRLARNFDLDAGYRYERQRFERDTEAATNNSVYFTMTYRLPSAPPGRRPMPPGDSRY